MPRRVAGFNGIDEEWARWFAEDPPARYVARLGVDTPLVSSRMTAVRAEA